MLDPIFVLRHLRPDDDLERLAALIRAAYAPHGAGGLRYWGTHQTAADTADRFAQGTGFVALCGAEYVGTVTVRPPQPHSPVPLYREPTTWTFGQFAVSPAVKGRGLGKALHAAAVEHAVRHGARFMALDTAAPAAGLIAMYRAWGYEICGEHDWRPQTNYLSVLMIRPLENEPPATGAPSLNPPGPSS